MQWVDQRADKHHTIDARGLFFDEGAYQITAIGLADQQVMLVGDDSFDEVLDDLKHLVGAVEPIKCRSLAHARKIEVNALVAGAVCKNRFHTSRHDAVIG